MTGEDEGPSGWEHHSRESMAALLDAVLAVSSDLELPEVLTRIVESACSLVGARYGALGVLRPDGEYLAEFVTHGVTDEERRAIGELPQGHGIVGLLIREPRVQRLREISEHPQSYGFPPHHPPMHSFLGAPVRVRDEVFGNLYLTEKQGAREFSEEDETLLSALAAAAGVAIENARLYASSKRLRAWSDAVAELTQTLLSGPQEQPALDKMVTLAGERAYAPLAFVLLYDEDGALVVRARQTPDVSPARASAAGWSASLGVGNRIDPATWDAITSPFVRGTNDTDGDPAVSKDVEILAGRTVGRFAIMPLGPGRDHLGFLVVVWDPGHDPSDAEVVKPLLEFGQHAGLALLAARSQRDQTLLALLEDRDRIARDMHDHVIQRLFATGLSLQSAARLAVHPTVRERLDDAVDDLDGAIKDIRHTIYELHRMPAGTIRDEIAGLIGDASELLGFEPTLLIEGRLAGLTDSLAADLVAVVREALANIVKHARATSVRVHLRCDNHVRIVVTDDGVGMDPASARSGLVNLGSRAASRAGTFEINPAAPAGTVLAWTVPAERDH
ncbi:GAF domain-containing sensor histidine kinase [Segeticoccus rhizosphaerae]|jgi:signal transduction histidine kinase|uniref:GAF domain-containing sensor histidine kinase n=1 Tax=Segeticoccus rhizosphaerae TaxID=1104777 RepID=UPI0012651D64|nr:GAF domain-containing sensor histidine kinase [Segeticoccus rhizosphaerae]